MKVGDRVKIVDTDFENSYLANGCEGIIVKDYGNCFGIKLDTGEEPLFDIDESYSWAFYPTQIEVING